MAARQSSKRLPWIESFCQDVVTPWGFSFYFPVGLSPGQLKYHIHFPNSQHRARYSSLGLSAVEQHCASRFGAHLLPLEHVLLISLHFYHHFLLRDIEQNIL